MNLEQCTEIINNSTPVRQGDILLFDQKPEGEKYGIIVTGDCDIFQKKCRGIISYCTITTVKHYISTELLPEIYILKEINRLKEIVLRGVCKILKADSSPTFLSTLLNQDESYLSNLINDQALLNKIYILKTIIKKTEFNLSDCSDIFRTINNRDIDDENRQKIKNKILSKLNSLPGDKYYISELPNQNDTYGYIVHLRLINTISLDDIEKQNYLYRIGHLESPYLYRLTQKLGAVFSDIGEPEDFERSKVEINKFICEDLI